MSRQVGHDVAGEAPSGCDRSGRRRRRRERWRCRGKRGEKNTFCGAEVGVVGARGVRELRESVIGIWRTGYWRTSRMKPKCSV